MATPTPSIETAPGPNPAAMAIGDGGRADAGVTA